MNQIAQYANCFRTMDNFKRVCTAWLVMFFQQWSGIDASELIDLAWWCFANGFQSSTMPPTYFLVLV
jgi:hypothetical protein